MKRVKWIQTLLDPRNLFTLDDEEKQKMLHFTAIVFKEIWFMRNKVRHGATTPNWESFSNQVNRICTKYLEAAKQRKSCFKKNKPPARWSPPPLEEYKLNFDISLLDNQAFAAIVLRNHHGVLVEAWINHFFSSNSFCEEMEVAIQAFKISENLRLSNVWFEGDTLQVVLALRGLDQHCEWRARKSCEKGRNFLSKFPFLCFNHVNRSGNSCAHNIARWAWSSNVSGSLDVTTIPPGLIYDHGGTDVSSDEVDLSNI